MRSWLIGVLSAAVVGPLWPADRVTVIVELFTSEGCSSCPAADRLLTQLDKVQPVPEAEIISLGEHVDYWNQLGWLDRFASHLFTVRQQSYARAFGLEDIYTPEMVVDGESECNGADAQRVLRAIRRAAGRPHAAVTLGRKDASNLALNVDQFPDGIKNVEIFLAITEDALASDVRKGENAGRRLNHSGVVRSLASLAHVDPRKSAGYAANVPLPLQAGWDRQNLQAVVLVEDRNTRRIIGAARLRLPTNPQQSVPPSALPGALTPRQ